MTGPHSPFDTEGFARHVYSVGGIPTVIYTIGNGPPVMYWHGGGTWHGFAWLREWRDRFRVIVPYHPGFGESGDDPKIASMDDYVRHYAALFDAMALRSVALVGASLGGYMAAAFAAAHPGRVTKLVLASSAGISSPDLPMADFSAVKPDEMLGMFIVDTGVVAPFWPDRWTERAAREMQSTGKMLAPVPSEDGEFTRRIGGLTMPALVLWGEDDRILPAGLAGLWGKALPHAIVRIIPGAGHLLLDELAAARDAAAAFLA